jgi:Lipocalin-like domain
MSVSINSDQAKSPWLDSLLFYAGTFEISENQVIHNVTNATEPKRIGTRMLREAILTGNRLSLIANGDFGTATLVWEKV